MMPPSAIRTESAFQRDLPASSDEGQRSASRSTARSHPQGASREIELPIVGDPRGNLTFIESDRHIPFPIQRVYYLYDVPGGAQRGGHAHRGVHEFIIAMSGSFDIILDDGSEPVVHHMRRSYMGLYVAPMVWRQLENFSSGSVCLVLASSYFNESDYIRDYDEFLAAIGGR